MATPQPMFQLRHSLSDHQGEFTTLTGEPRRRGGGSLGKLSGFGMRRDEVAVGVSVRDLDGPELQLERNARVGDILDWNVRGNIAVSGRLLSALKDMNLLLDESIQVVPLHVIPRGSARLVARDYFVLWAHQDHDILDVANADVKLTRSGAVLRVNRWAFDWARVPPWDLFRAGPVETWMCTERVRECVERARLIGVHFRALG